MFMYFRRCIKYKHSEVAQLRLSLNCRHECSKYPPHLNHQTRSWLCLMIICLVFKFEDSNAQRWSEFSINHLNYLIKGS